MKVDNHLRTLAGHILQILPADGIWSFGWKTHLFPDLIPTNLMPKDSVGLFTPTVQVGRTNLQVCLTVEDKDHTTAYVIVDGRTRAPGGDIIFADIMGWSQPMAKALFHLVQTPHPITKEDAYFAVLQRQPWTFHADGDSAWALSNPIRIYSDCTEGETYQIKVRMSGNACNAYSVHFIREDDGQEYAGWQAETFPFRRFQLRGKKHWSLPLAHRLYRHLQAQEAIRGCLILRGFTAPASKS